ncbi:Innexin inx2 [Orchesella cincta]|uniref:Innexin n=1 Tax=Orchesella cincta TaxID=48709 RepID=A0A1D2NGE6_ORCCI|nr:Innexin inx2 [Orchesella cincta]
MQNLVSGVKNILSYKRKARIDNLVFALHKVTAGVLLLLSIIVSSGIYVAKPISCISDKTVDRVIDAYCWIHSTYTIPNKTNSALNEIQVAHPGVAPLDADDEIRVHKYYQWVCFVLFFQAAAFIFPRVIWKRLERNRIYTLSSIGFEEMAKNEEALSKRRKQCVDYFHQCLGTNDSWALTYAVCEVLNFINVVIQIDLTDRFVGRALSKYGLSLMQFSSQNPLMRDDPMAAAFPTVTKCMFHMVGPTGNLVNFDSLCVLPLNIYNEKFYPLLWVWFIFLAVLSGLAILYRIFTFLLPEVRHELLKRKFYMATAEIRNLGRVNLKLDYGDWFLLYQIGKNMRPSAFCEFLDDLVNRFSDERDLTSKAAAKEKYL